MNFQIISLNDDSNNKCKLKLWDRIVCSFSEYSICYLSGYVNAFKLRGEGEPLLFYFQNDSTRALNVVMKRDIAKDINFIGKIPTNTYFDFSTPYGYGGWIIEGENPNDIIKLYEKYCTEHNIISEFVRYNPLLNNNNCPKNAYDTVPIRKVLYTDLTCNNPVDIEFSKEAKKKIRKLLNKGISYKISKTSNGVNDFIELYRQTMQKNNAVSFYYFDEAFFAVLLKQLDGQYVFVNVIFDNIIIGIGLFLLCKKTIHFFLSATKTDYLKLSPEYIIRYAITNWGVQNNYSIIFHGGGRSNDTNDALYKFKKQFAQNNELDFYIGKKIFNSNIYNELVNIRKSNNEFDYNTDFFPIYRA